MVSLVVFLLLFVSELFSQELQNTNVLTVFEGEPSTNICGAINVITGDFFVSEEDICVEGVEPVRLRRCYLSAQAEAPFRGWSHPIVSTMSFYQHSFGYAAAGTVHLHEANGSALSQTSHIFDKSVIKSKEEKKKKKKRHGKGLPYAPETQGEFRLHPAMLQNGVTNCGRGDLSGRSNLKNTQIRISENEKWATYYKGNGTTRLYKKCQSILARIDFMLQEESLPSGNWILYSYDERGAITEIRTVNPSKTRCYAWARFIYGGKEDPGAFTVHTSDGKQYCYRSLLSTQGRVSLLDKIIHADLPEEQIYYHPATNDRPELVSCRGFTNGRAMHVGYYQRNQNVVNGEGIYLERKDPRLHRVSSLSAPVGCDERPIPIHILLYHPGDPGKTIGWTDDYDAYGNLTRYHYLPNMCLSSTEFYQKGGQGQVLDHIENCFWGDGDTPLQGNLLGKTYCGPDQRPLFAKWYHYDENGNVVAEELMGNLTGERAIQMATLDGKTPDRHSAEVACKWFQYSKDGRNLPTRKHEENGTITLISYLPSTDFPTEKFTVDQDKIVLRQFFEYNSDHILVKEIIDNGSSNKKGDLTGVTHRKIKVIYPRMEELFFGLPAAVEERYLEDGEEKLLSKVLFTYSPQGKVTRKEIFDADGIYRYSLDYLYDKRGKLIQETNPIGQTATFSYDPHGNLISQTDFSGCLTTSMVYDFSNRLLQKRETDGVTTHTTHYRYDYKDNLIAEIDAFGNETSHTYDALGRRLSTKFPQIEESSGAVVHPVLRTTYDSTGNPISKTDCRGETTYFSYNSRGKPIEICYPDGSKERFIYFLDGQLKSQIDQEGTITSYTYDYQGRVLSKTIQSAEREVLAQEVFTYNAFHLLSKRDAEGNLTIYSYDKAGRLCSEEFGLEKKILTYDSLGRLHTTTCCSKTTPSISFIEYDLLNRPIKERVEDQFGKILSQVAYTYDAFGNKASITQFIGDGSSTEFFDYDPFGRAIKQIDPLGNCTQIRYEENHLNSLGQRVLKKIHIDPRGVQTIEIHNAVGKVVIAQKVDPFGLELNREEFFYDIGGNLCRQESFICSDAAPTRTSVIRWEYGCMDRLISITEADGTRDEKTTRYTYTLKGLKHHIFKPDGIVLTCSYDPLGRLTSQTSSDGRYRYAFEYNRIGYLIAAHNLNTGSSTLRTYDGQGHLLEERLENGLQLQSSYDDRGRRTLLTLPDRTSIQYAYDPLYLTEVTRCDASLNPLYTHRYLAFDPSGHLLAEEQIDGLGSIEYTVDPLGRWDSLYSPYFEQEIQEVDPNGKILRMQWKMPHCQDAAHYTYDFLSQLTQENTRYPHQFAYDSHNNRLQADDEVHTINALNQLLSRGDTEYEYDPNGNLLRKTTPTEETFYRYDPLDRLIEVEFPARQLIRFSYDSFHRRISKTSYHWHNNFWEKQEHCLFFYDEEKEIGAAIDPDHLVQLRVLGSTPRAEIGAAIAIEIKRQVYLPIHDIQGNVRCLVSLRTRAIAESYEYSAFKEEAVLDHTGKRHSLSRIQNPWRFSSKRLDEDTGLIYYGRRFYDPQAGRWITPDPKGFTDGLNLYAFVHNDPLTQFDLYGLEALERSMTERSWFLRSFEATMGFAQACGRFVAPDGIHDDEAFPPCRHAIGDSGALPVSSPEKIPLARPFSIY